MAAIAAVLSRPAARRGRSHEERPPLKPSRELARPSLNQRNRFAFVSPPAAPARTRGTSSGPISNCAKRLDGWAVARLSCSRPARSSGMANLRASAGGPYAPPWAASPQWPPPGRPSHPRIRLLDDGVDSARMVGSSTPPAAWTLSICGPERRGGWRVERRRASSASPTVSGRGRFAGGSAWRGGAAASSSACKRRARASDAASSSSRARCGCCCGAAGASSSLSFVRSIVSAIVSGAGLLGWLRRVLALGTAIDGFSESPYVERSSDSARWRWSHRPRRSLQSSGFAKLVCLDTLAAKPRRENSRADV